MPTSTIVQNFDDQQQFRSATIDRTLRSSMQALYQSIVSLQQARDQYFALGMNTQLTGVANNEWVHKERDASTKQEQADIDLVLAHVNAQLLGVGSSAAVPATVAGILKRYAR